MWRTGLLAPPRLEPRRCLLGPETETGSVRRGVLVAIVGAREAGFPIHAVDTATDSVFTEFVPVDDGGPPIGFAVHVAKDGVIEIETLPGSPEYSGAMLMRAEKRASAFVLGVSSRMCVPAPELEATAAEAGVVLPADYGR